MARVYGYRTLPDFIIIGAQKAATTSLFSYMGQHPSIRLSRKKEVHYFDLHYARGPGWYAGYFPLAGGVLSLFRPLSKIAAPAWLTGEASPSYLFLPEVPGRMKAMLPEVKLIVSLRDPVERLVSQYFHERRRRRFSGRFEDYVAPSLHAAWPPEGDIEWIRQNCAVPRGFYADQLRHWLSYYPRESLHVIRFEHLVKEPEAVLKKVFAFVGLAPCPVDASRVLMKGLNREKDAIDPKLLERLRDLYREKNRDLPLLIGPEFQW